MKKKKLHIVSGLHLDFGGPGPPPVEADLIIAAGDISTGVHGLLWLRDHFPNQPPLYVPGNHEYFKHNYPALPEKLRDLAERSNVRIMDGNSLDTDGLTDLP